VKASKWSVGSRQSPSTERVAPACGGTPYLTLYSQRYLAPVTRIEADAVEFGRWGAHLPWINEDGSFGRPMAPLTRVELGQSLKVCTCILDVARTGKSLSRASRPDSLHPATSSRSACEGSSPRSARPISAGSERQSADTKQE